MYNLRWLRIIYCLSVVDPMADMLHLIKQGVKLKPVSKDSERKMPPQSMTTPSDTHAQQLKEVLDRISKRLNQPSDDEEEGQDSDYEDFDN